MNLARRVLPESRRRGWCPSLAQPMPTGDGLLARVHPPLGRLTPGQLRAVAEGARRFGNGHVDVTARANLQIRGVREATATALAALLTGVGLGDRRTDSGPHRLTLTSPLVSLDPAEPIDVLALACAIEEAALGISGLPPKTLVAITGVGVDGEGADLVLRSEVGGQVAIRLAGGGDEVVVPAIATVATVVALLRAFAATGHRRIRDLAPDQRIAVRSCGSEGDVHALNPPPSVGEGACGAGERGERRIRIGHSPFATPATDSPLFRSDEGRAVTRDAPQTLLPARMLGQHAMLAIDAPFGRCTAEGLERLARTADTLDCTDIRVSPSRGFVLARVDRDAAASALAALTEAGFVTSPDDPRRAVAACPGAPACASGSTPAAADAARLAQAFVHFAARGLDAHVSGCAKGCAHPAPASLTLVGEAGHYRVVLDGAPGGAWGPLETFESVLERVSTADPTRPLDQAFRP